MIASNLNINLNIFMGFATNRFKKHKVEEMDFVSS